MDWKSLEKHRNYFSTALKISQKNTRRKEALLESLHAAITFP